MSYTDTGLLAFPVRPGSKRPVRKGWQTTATDDGERLYRTFCKFSGCNLGLRMGGEIRLGEYAFALDVDPRNAGFDSLDRLVRRLHVARLSNLGGAFAASGGGGLHFLFTAPWPVRNGRLRGHPGIDIKGVGGFIVAAPSVHPETGWPYFWERHPKTHGINPAPRQLLKLIRHHEGGKTPRPTHGENPEPCPVAKSHRPPSPVPTRTGPVDDLTATAIRLFPVPAVGTRWNEMRRAVGRFVGQGYDNDVIRETMRAWYDHFDRIGVIGTRKADADIELERCIASTRTNPEFTRAVSVDAGNHRWRCRQIGLGDGLIRIIQAGQLTPTENTSSNSLTRRSGRLSDCSGLSDRETAFAASIVAWTLYKISTGELGADRRFFLTNEDITAAASDRYPEIGWDAKQVEREKRKFISRPDDGKPASRSELLREIHKGKRLRGQTVGTPSTYVATGVLNLIRNHPLAREALGATTEGQPYRALA